MSIALVDCNSFFCSCEVAFRPELENKPVIVLSNNDGCVVARNSFAKQLPIGMGQPFYQIKDVIAFHHVHCFSSNYALYADMSSRVMNTLAQFSPEMEIYSIDEAFLNLKGFEHLGLTQYAQQIRQTVFKNIHIPVSVGIGPTKVLAKLANHLAKKFPQTQGVVDLTTKEMQDRALLKVDISDVWGIGRQSAAKLKILGIKTALQLRDYPNDQQILKLLTKTGLQIKHELKGEACIPLQMFAEKKKQIISSRSFGAPVYELNDLKESVASYITIAAEKLRSQKSVAGAINVYIRTNHFKDGPQYFNMGSRTFNAGVADTRKLVRAGFEILQEIYKPGFEYKKAGIMLGDISDQSHQQLSLFEQYDAGSDDKLMQTIDFINRREAEQSIALAACGIEKKWAMARNHKSPSYTTRWTDILKVK